MAHLTPLMGKMGGNVIKGTIFTPISNWENNIFWGPNKNLSFLTMKLDYASSLDDFEVLEYAHVLAVLLVT
jgi:hypothetical protein